MAVTFDAVGPSSSGQGATSTNTATWSHTCSGSNRLLIVSATVGHTTGSFTATATCNGSALTSVARQNSNNSTFGWVQMWQLVDPPDACTLVITASTTVNAITGGSVSFNGVDQDTPLGTPVTGFGDATTAPNIIMPATTPGNMIVDSVADGALGGITASSQTLRWVRNINNSTAAGNGASSTAACTGGAVQMAYTAVDDWFGMIGVEVIAADAGTDQIRVPTVTIQYP